MTLLKKIRLEKGISQKVVAIDLQMSRQNIHSIENGKWKPNYKVLAYYLKMRGKEQDLKLVEILEELDGKCNDINERR